MLPNFTGLISIEAMYLSSNKIGKLRNGTFHELRTLKILWLDKNSLTDIDYGAFYGLSSLIHLNLNENKLNATRWDLESMATLEELHLEKNKITEYPKYKGNNTVLRKLFLSNNLICEIRNESYKQFLMLETLDLSHNLLTDFPIEIIESIKVK